MQNPQQRSDQTSGSEQDTKPGPVSHTQKQVGKTLLTYFVIAVVLGCILAAILFQRWTLIWIGALVLIPYALLLMAPVWLARSTKVAKDTQEE